MKRLESLGYLSRHAYRVWRAGQLRFRLETFGLYYPALPYRAPLWKLSPRSAVLLARQAPAYVRWILELEELRRSGAVGWWAARGFTGQREDLER